MKLKLLVAALIGALLAQTGVAQQGWEQIVLINKGSYVATTVISVGTGATVSLFSPNARRADQTCRNNSAFTIYIGTNASTTATSLVGIGFPVLTNETFELGAMSGDLYGIASGGTADVRCFEGAIR